MVRVNKVTIEDNLCDYIKELEEDKEYLINEMVGLVDVESLISMSARLFVKNNTITILKEFIE